MNINESAKTVASVIAILLIPVAVVIFGYYQNRPQASELNVEALELSSDVLDPEMDVISETENSNSITDGVNSGEVANTETENNTGLNESEDKIEISINGVKTLPNTSSRIE